MRYTSLVLVFAVGLLGCSSGASHHHGTGTKPDLATPDNPDEKTDLADPAPPDFGGAEGSPDLKPDSKPDLGPAQITVTQASAQPSSVVDGATILWTATVAGDPASVMLADSTLAGIADLAPNGKGMWSATVSWQTIASVVPLSFQGSKTVSLRVVASDGDGVPVSFKSVSVTFSCTSGAATNGVCNPPSVGKLGACVVPADATVTCGLICANQGKSCANLGCGGYSGDLISPDCTGSDTGGLTSTLDGSKMTCDSPLIVASSLGFGVRCCCN